MVKLTITEKPPEGKYLMVVCGDRINSNLEELIYVEGLEDKISIKEFRGTISNVLDALISFKEVKDVNMTKDESEYIRVNLENLPGSPNFYESAQVIAEGNGIPELLHKIHRLTKERLKDGKMVCCSDPVHSRLGKTNMICLACKSHLYKGHVYGRKIWEQILENYKWFPYPEEGAQS